MKVEAADQSTAMPQPHPREPAIRPGLQPWRRPFLGVALALTGCLVYWGAPLLASAADAGLWSPRTSFVIQRGGSEPASLSLTMWNLSPQPRRVLSVVPTCGCSTVGERPGVVPPFQSRRMTVVVNPSESEREHQRLTVSSTGPDGADLAQLVFHFTFRHDANKSGMRRELKPDAHTHEQRP